MKTIIVFALAAFVSFGSAANETPKEEPKTKKVCITKTDPKTKKDTEVCKTVKVHKKLEGTKVPERKQ